MWLWGAGSGGALLFWFGGCLRRCALYRLGASPDVITDRGRGEDYTMVLVPFRHLTSFTTD